MPPPMPTSPPASMSCSSVTDTGTGMPPEVVERAFDPFFTTKAVGQGHGPWAQPGLWLRQAVRRPREDLFGARSGTTVKIYLPRFTGAECRGRDRRRRAIRRLPSGAGGEIVLVVEDEPACGSFSVDALRELGYTVVQADGRGSRRWQLLDDAAGVDLLFTDIVMPDMNGRQLAERRASRGRS